MASRGRTRTKIEGMKQLDQRMDELSDEMREAAHEAVVESAEQIRDDTSGSVRNDTGNLSDMVEARYEDDGLTAQVGWFEDDEYYAEFAEYGGGMGYPAAPSLEPAYRAEAKRFPDRLEQKLKRALK